MLPLVIEEREDFLWFSDTDDPSFLDNSPFVEAHVSSLLNPLAEDARATSSCSLSDVVDPSFMDLKLSRDDLLRDDCEGSCCTCSEKLCSTAFSSRLLADPLRLLEGSAASFPAVDVEYFVVSVTEEHGDIVSFKVEDDLTFTDVREDCEVESSLLIDTFDDFLSFSDEDEPSLAAFMDG